MASYFVARQPLGDGAHAVHDRSRCPPHSFPREGAEYLGEYLAPSQALAVARLRYAHVSPCACCVPALVAALVDNLSSLTLRS